MECDRFLKHFLEKVEVGFKCARGFLFESPNHRQKHKKVDKIEKRLGIENVEIIIKGPEYQERKEKKWDFNTRPFRFQNEAWEEELKV